MLRNTVPTSTVLSYALNMIATAIELQTPEPDSAEGNEAMRVEGPADRAEVTV